MINKHKENLLPKIFITRNVQKIIPSRMKILQSELRGTQKKEKYQRRNK